MNDEKRKRTLARAYFGFTRFPRAHEGLSDKGAAFINEKFPAGMSQEDACLTIGNALSFFDSDEAATSREAQQRRRKIPSPLRPSDDIEVEIPADPLDSSPPSAETESEGNKRGRPQYVALDKLLTEIIAAWRREFFYEGRGITRSNSSGEGQQYRGPLLDFVEQLLKIEGVGWTHRDGVADFRSNKSLGKRLFRLTK